MGRAKRHGAARASARRGVSALLVLMGLAMAWIEPAHADSIDGPLNLGTIDESPSKMTRRFALLVDYLRGKGLNVGKIVTLPAMNKTLYASC